MGRFLASKINDKPKNIISKRHHKINQFWGRFFIDFSCVLEAHLGPMLATFLGPRRPKKPPRRSQDASKTIPRAPHDPRPPGLIGYPSFGRLWASILVPPGLDFEASWFKLDPIFGWFWEPFSCANSKHITCFLVKFCKCFSTSNFLFWVSAVAGSPLCGALDSF